MKTEKENIEEEIGSIIKTVEPLFPDYNWLRHPFLEWDAFKVPLNQIFRGSSYIFHGPHQSGKSSLLLLLQSIFQQQRIRCAFLDMTSLQGYLKIHGPRKGFSQYISYQLFQETLSPGELDCRIRDLEENSYLLLDELQYIFTDEELLDTVKTFLKSISNTNLFYVAVGSSKLLDLMKCKASETDFNKATFVRIPFFKEAEMNYLFDKYQERVNKAGIPTEIAVNIMLGSYGHPASFMILLKIFEDFQCKTIEEWRITLQTHIEKYMNKIHIKIKECLLEKNEEEKAYIRDLTSRTDGWDTDLYYVSKVEKDLLDIGVLTISSNGKRLLFTSDIILRICINTLSPQSLAKILLN